MSLSAALLGLWTLGHPIVLTEYTNPYLADVAQAYALAWVLVAQGTNRFVIGPLTSSTMFERHKLEKKEGKNYNDEGVCGILYFGGSTSFRLIPACPNPGF